MIFQRLPMLAMSARNSALRFLHHTSIGQLMPPPYSGAQIEVARQIWTFFKAKGADDIGAAVWCGNTDGETSFDIHVWGDHHEAVDIAQHHKDRRDLIKRYTGIDMATAEIGDQLKGVWWEITDPHSSYRKVWPAFQAEPALEGKVAILVSKFEQSGSQSRDIARRTGLSEFWLAYGKQNWGAAA